MNTNKKLVLILLASFSLLFFSLLVSAQVSISGGECQAISFPNEDPVEFEIISNTSSMDGFSWTKNGTNIEYCFALNSESGDFEVRWFNEKAEVSSSSSSGGGSGGFFHNDHDSHEEENEEAGGGGTNYENEEPNSEFPTRELSYFEEHPYQLTLIVLGLIFLVYLLVHLIKKKSLNNQKRDIELKGGNEHEDQ